MRYEVSITDSALADMEEIYCYIRDSLYSPDSAAAKTGDGKTVPLFNLYQRYLFMTRSSPGSR